MYCILVILISCQVAVSCLGSHAWLYGLLSFHLERLAIFSFQQTCLVSEEPSYGLYIRTEFFHYTIFYVICNPNQLASCGLQRNFSPDEEPLYGAQINWDFFHYAALACSYRLFMHKFLWNLWSWQRAVYSNVVQLVKRFRTVYTLIQNVFTTWC